MSILDDAIREHLELKRAHGADEAEVKKLEDEAFGPAQRPEEGDPFAEAPTEFLTAPGEEEIEGGEAEGRRVPNIADLQEPPPPAPAPTPAEVAEEPREPSVEEQPAAEHQVIPEAEPELDPEPAAEEPKPDGVHTTEEREAIADQPTEMFDVEAELVASSEPASPSDEELLDAGLVEPRLAPVDPVPELEEIEDDDDFFSEQRLSDELNQALEAPVTEEEPLPPPAAPPTEEGTAIFDLEEAGDAGAKPAPEPESDEHSVYEPETGSHEDVLEDTPEFLEDAPEDDELWFEQKPPKDFDLD